MHHNARGCVHLSAQKLPRRPGAHTLSNAIHLFFIGQNRDGLWIARDAEGRVGGIFWCRRSALNFSDESTAPVGCAKMFMCRPIELDIKNNGNRLVTRLSVVKRVLTRFRVILTALLGIATLKD